MKRAVAVLLVLASCGGSDAPDVTTPPPFDSEAATQAWLDAVAPFVPQDLDLVIADMATACTGENETAWIVYEAFGDTTAYDAAMAAGCADPPSWWSDAND